MNRCLVVPGLLATALLPALVPSADAHAPRQTRIEHQNNLKQIGLAMHNYESTFKRLPAAAIFDKEGKPLLSWRVAILPFLDQDALYKKLKLDEPWDSPNNIKLLENMPKVFGPLGDGKDDIGKTCYRVFHGPGAVFDGKKGIPLTGIVDGTSNTIMVVEARDGVPWTKPDELVYKEKDVLPKLGRNAKEGFTVLLCDGSVMTFRQDYNVEHMHRAILRADGNTVDFSLLER
jgi:hypothetical protein